MEHPGTEPDPGEERRGRHAAPAASPAGGLGRVATRTTAVIAAALEAAHRLVDRVRTGPVLPWISAHRVLVLVVAALVVSGVAFAGTAALIAQTPGPVAEGDATDADPSRPRPGSDFVMPDPTPGAVTASPSPTPPSTGGPGTPADDPSLDPAPTADPEPTGDPAEPTAEPTGNGRPDPPGATNRPDKKKD
ncbi:hypothetical protein GCM10009819_22730 [Agromyces tropicus]|uniref:Uncharacterized protein n=1 Tax=Agromyces tropicus TaxID=555371 RepID=A0ABN2UJ32_9MICO